ncbi:hypothetical protein, partial [Ruegeria atlantica]|uniref:hypothetical protein n=1 Tax=Ruegeria atlantica TaxID=81569 RepID=UPI00147F66EE
MDEKQEIATHLSRNVVGSSQDPTRSTLHTGQQFSGVFERNDRSEGAPEELTSRTVPEPQSGSASIADPVASTLSSTTAPSRSAVQNTRAEEPVIVENSGLVETFRSAVSSPQPTENLEIVHASKPSARPDTQDLPNMDAPPEASTNSQNGNNAPQELNLGNTSVAENAQGAVIGSISVLDPDASDT